jgi:hypothetical protein
MQPRIGERGENVNVSEIVDFGDKADANGSRLLFDRRELREYVHNGGARRP